MKYVLMLAACLVGADAWAQSARFGSSMLSVGDPFSRVKDVAGSPEAVERSEDGIEIWTYRRKGRVVQLWISGGKIVRVDDRKDVAKD
jgi:hypothetical protein